MLLVTWTHTISGRLDWHKWACSQYGKDRSTAESEADAETRNMESNGWRETERIYIP